MNSSSLSGLPNTSNKYNVDSISNLQREPREWRYVHVPRNVHIFHKIYTFSGAQSCSYWFPSPSLHFDGGITVDNTVTLKLSSYDYSTKKVQQLTAALPPQPVILNRLLLISVSGLWSGVADQIKPLPTNLIGCAQKLFLHVDGTADWAANVSSTVNWIKNSVLLLNTWRKCGSVSRGKLWNWSRSKMKYKRYRRNNVVIFHLQTVLSLLKVVFLHSQGTVVLFHPGTPGVEVTFHFSQKAYFSEVVFSFHICRNLIIHVLETTLIIRFYRATDLIIRIKPNKLFSCTCFKKKGRGSSWANKRSVLANTKMSVRIPALPQCQSVIWEHDVVTARMLSCAEAAYLALNSLLFFSCRAVLCLQCWMLEHRLARHLRVLLLIYKNEHFFQ